MRNLLLIALVIILGMASCKKEDPKPDKPTTTLPVPKDKLIM
jgi:hypothetical protein